jgi:hypothetical protein
MWKSLTAPLILGLAGLTPVGPQDPVRLVSPDQQSAPDQAAQLLPPLELANFQQSSADSLDSLFGQTLLLEYFAYW